MKLTTKSIVVILFIFVVFFGFTIAGAIMQALFYNPQAEERQIQLPETNIIDYKLNQEQENYLLQNYKTILVYEYDLVCTGCLENKAILEQLASSNQFKDQVFLATLLSNTSVESPTLTIFSLRGQKTLTNATVDEILNNLCDLMIQPPVQCALREV